MTVDGVIRKSVTTNPRLVGDRYTERCGDGVATTLEVVHVEALTGSLSLAGLWSEHSRLLDRGDPPPPESLPCAVCAELIGDRNWEWAAMARNGPVHLECFMTDEQLLAEIEPGVDVVNFADGINNATIYRDGTIDRCRG